MWDVRVPRDLRNWKDREESKGKGERKNKAESLLH